jgi:hypothetical protein
MIVSGYLDAWSMTSIAFSENLYRLRQKIIEKTDMKALDT